MAVGLIVIVLISQALGVDLTGFVDTGANSGADTSLEDCDTGADANANLECRIDFAAQSMDRYITPTGALRRLGEHRMRRSVKRGRPLLLPTRPDQTVHLDVAFPASLMTVESIHGLALPRVELSSTAAVRTVIAAGTASGVLSSLAIADDLALGRLVAIPIVGISLRRQLSAVVLGQRRGLNDRTVRY